LWLFLSRRCREKLEITVVFKFYFTETLVEMGKEKKGVGNRGERREEKVSKEDKGGRV
jgi:hypothetical protein